MSNLLFELSMATASDPAIFPRIEIEPSKIIVHRGNGQLPPGWTLNDSIRLNGPLTYEPPVRAPALGAGIPARPKNTGKLKRFLRGLGN